MSLLKRLFGKNEPPKQRVRVCVECGMPIAEHKEWCSILRGQREMQRNSNEPAPRLKNSRRFHIGGSPYYSTSGSVSGKLPVGDDQSRNVSVILCVVSDQR